MRRLHFDLFDEAPMATSVLERHAHRLLRNAGITGWIPQFQPPWYDGVRGVVDLAWPSCRLIMEVDGRRWHATTQAQSDDRRRDRVAAAHGWTTARFGWREITQRPAAVAAEIQALLHGQP